METPAATCRIHFTPPLTELFTKLPVAVLQLEPEAAA